MQNKEHLIFKKCLNCSEKSIFLMFRIIRNILEKKIFGVSSWWSYKLGVSASIIRLFFIYFSFTNTFTVLVYLIMSLILRFRKYFKYRKKSVFDL